MLEPLSIADAHICDHVADCIGVHVSMWAAVRQEGGGHLAYGCGSMETRPAHSSLLDLHTQRDAVWHRSKDIDYTLLSQSQHVCLAVALPTHASDSHQARTFGRSEQEESPDMAVWCWLCRCLLAQ